MANQSSESKINDIHSWWEVPCIAHFCSLFRVSFDLIDFDIEDLEEALLTDDNSDSGNNLMQELIVRLLRGYYEDEKDAIKTSNYQMFLRRLFREKCREYDILNPFDSDVNFQTLPMRTKVEILHKLCDFRLDGDDVLDILRDLDSDSLRVQPLGFDANKSAYWYFYGTRLYREDYPKVPKKEKVKKRGRKPKKKVIENSDDESNMPVEIGAGEWQVICFSESDWQRLSVNTQHSSDRNEQILHKIIKEDFLPEIPNLFQEKERLQRKRFLESHPRKSSRIQSIKKRKEEEKQYYEEYEHIVGCDSSDSNSSEEDVEEIAAKKAKDERLERLNNRNSLKENESNDSDDDNSDYDSPRGSSSKSFKVVSQGRRTNNSLSSATDDIMLLHTAGSTSPKRCDTKIEGLHNGMCKVLRKLSQHKDSEPFFHLEYEEHAPKYHQVIKNPMDLQRMEDKIENGKYKGVIEFKRDFKLMLDNCKRYYGSKNDLMHKGARLEKAFNTFVKRYITSIPASDSDDVLGSNEYTNKTKQFIKKKKGKSIGADKENEEKLSDKAYSLNTIDNDVSNEFESKFTKRGKGRPPKHTSTSYALDLVAEQAIKDMMKFLDEDPPQCPDYNFPIISPPPITPEPEPEPELEPPPPILSPAIPADPPTVEIVTEPETVVKTVDEPINEPSPQPPILPPLTTTITMTTMTTTTTTTIVATSTAATSTVMLTESKKSKNSGTNKVAKSKDGVTQSKKKTNSKDNNHKHLQLIKQRPRDKRTIDRLQPGKSKGNLLSTISKPLLLNRPKSFKDSNISSIIGSGQKDLKSHDTEATKTKPVLNLGTVLTTDIDMIFANNDSQSVSASAKEQQTFNDYKKDDELQAENLAVNRNITKVGLYSDKNCNAINETESATTEKPDIDIISNNESNDIIVKPTIQWGSSTTTNSTSTTDKPVAKAKPNYVAWIQAFGGGKKTTAAGVQKKNEYSFNEPPATPLFRDVHDDEYSQPPPTPKVMNDQLRYDINEAPPPTPGRFFLDEDDHQPRNSNHYIPASSSDLPYQRQRRLSTGSTVSERSTLSQDPMNSPHPSLDEPGYQSPQQSNVIQQQLPYQSPLSPHQVGGNNVGVGFYQDAFSKGIGSGSDKSNSCSPRNQPNSVSPQHPMFSPRDSIGASPRDSVGSMCSPSPRGAGDHYNMTAHSSPRSNHPSPRYSIDTGMSPRDTPSYHESSPYSASQPPMKSPVYSPHQLDSQSSDTNSPAHNYNATSPLQSSNMIGSVLQTAKNPYMYPVKKRFNVEMEQQQQLQKRNNEEIVDDGRMHSQQESQYTHNMATQRVLPSHPTYAESYAVAHQPQSPVDSAAVSPYYRKDLYATQKHHLLTTPAVVSSQQQHQLHPNGSLYTSSSTNTINDEQYNSTVVSSTALYNRSSALLNYAAPPITEVGHKPLSLTTNKSNEYGDDTSGSYYSSVSSTPTKFDTLNFNKTTAHHNPFYPPTVAPHQQQHQQPSSVNNAVTSAAPLLHQPYETRVTTATTVTSSLYHSPVSAHSSYPPPPSSVAPYSNHPAIPTQTVEPYYNSSGSSSSNKINSKAAPTNYHHMFTNPSSLYYHQNTVAGQTENVTSGTTLSYTSSSYRNSITNSSKQTTPITPPTTKATTSVRKSRKRKGTASTSGNSVPVDNSTLPTFTTAAYTGPGSSNVVFTSATITPSTRVTDVKNHNAANSLTNSATSAPAFNFSAAAQFYNLSNPYFMSEAAAAVAASNNSLIQQQQQRNKTSTDARSSPYSLAGTHPSSFPACPPSSIYSSPYLPRSSDELIMLQQGLMSSHPPHPSTYPAPGYFDYPRY